MAIELRDDFNAPMVRAEAKRSKNGAHRTASMGAWVLINGTWYEIL